MSVGNAGQIPWADKMRRTRTGTAPQAEWMAPDEVVERVRADYLEAVDWLQESTLISWAQQWSAAPYYLTGAYLKRHRNLLLSQRQAKGLQLTGILRADHMVDVRKFNARGDFCIVIDQQTQRRMATYNRQTLERSITQALGDSVLVYAMRYDAGEERWQIGGFVQELPAGWRFLSMIKELSTLPDSIGRDY